MQREQSEAVAIRRDRHDRSALIHMLFASVLDRDPELAAALLVVVERLATVHQK